MMGQLSASEIEAFLKLQSVARIGCHTDGKTYVVPITYAYDEDCIIGHSAEGLKIWMMRANRDVCVEVDSMTNPANWTSVVGQGRFEELDGEEALRALTQLRQRFEASSASSTALPAHALQPIDTGGKKDLTRRKAVIYRIRLFEKSGRFERSPPTTSSNH